MMKKLILSTAILLISNSLFAEQNSTATPDLTLLKSSLVPGAKIGEIKLSPLPGIYQVQINKDIVFISEDGNNLITGDIYNLKTREKVSDTARNGLRKEAINAISNSDKIIYKAKDEKHVVHIFTDISCPYCTKLHKDMKAYNDAGITIKYLAYPRAGVGSKPHKQMQSIWCAKDSADALTRAKVNNEKIKDKCEGTQVADQFMLGGELGVNATPTLIFDNGELHPGYRPPEELILLLEAKNGLIAKGNEK